MAHKFQPRHITLPPIFTTIRYKNNLGNLQINLYFKRLSPNVYKYNVILRELCTFGYTCHNKPPGSMTSKLH